VYSGPLASIVVQLPADKRPRGQVLSSTVLQALCEADAALTPHAPRGARQTYARKLLERRGWECAEREKRRERREARWRAVAEGRQAPALISDFGDGVRSRSEDLEALAAVAAADTNGKG